MIRSKDLNLEINALSEKIEKGDVSNVDVVKAVCLLVKVARDIRTNQTTIMRAQGVKLIEPQTNNDRARNDGEKKDK